MNSGTSPLVSVPLACSICVRDVCKNGNFFNYPLVVAIDSIYNSFIMPFTRRRRTRRTRRRTRRPAKALRAVRRLARFVDTELNQAVFIQEEDSITQAASFYNLVQVAQGDDDVNRDGLQISLRRVEIKFLVASGNIASCLRFILFVDKQSNGAQPLIGDLLQVTGTGLQQQVSPTSNDFKKRFTILRDFNKVVSADESNDKICFSLRRRLTNKMRFDGTTGAIADVVSGALWLVVFADTLGGANSPELTFISRTWFAP